MKLGSGRVTLLDLVKKVRGATAMKNGFGEQMNTVCLRKSRRTGSTGRRPFSSNHRSGWWNPLYKSQGNASSAAGGGFEQPVRFWLIGRMMLFDNGVGRVGGTGLC